MGHSKGSVERTKVQPGNYCTQKKGLGLRGPIVGLQWKDFSCLLKFYLCCEGILMVCLSPLSRTRNATMESSSLSIHFFGFSPSYSSFIISTVPKAKVSSCNKFSVHNVSFLRNCHSSHRLYTFSHDYVHCWSSHNFTH